MMYAFASVASGAESGWKRMDVNNLDLETDREELLFQYFFGIKRKGLVYMQYPAGEEVWTTDKNIPTTSSGHRKAFVDSLTSPLDDPSPLTMFVMVKGITAALDYYNSAEHALVQEVKFIGKKFQRLECKVGKAASWLNNKVLTEDDMAKIAAVAIPIQIRRIA
jgi:hypothetical protein